MCDLRQRRHGDAIPTDVPLAQLLGEPIEAGSRNDVLRPFFDYFELCEEQFYYRKTGKVSRSTYADWWEGIALNLSRPAFRQAWDELKDRVLVAPGASTVDRHEQFTLLREAVRLLDDGKRFDPASA